MPAQRAHRLQSAPTMPTGVEVASYPTYLEAQSAVDYLSDNGFDVSEITMVGTDLHMVERVTGRLTLGRVAASGASSGALWGAFMGLMMSFANPSGGMSWFLIGMGGGVVFGVLMSILLYGIAGGRRDFTSQSQVVASRYAVLASKEVEKAFTLLQKTPGNQMRPKPRRVRQEPSGPTEYGSRSDERPRFGVRLDAEHSRTTASRGEPGQQEPHASSGQESPQVQVQPEGDPQQVPPPQLGQNRPESEQKPADCDKA